MRVAIGVQPRLQALPDGKIVQVRQDRQATMRILVSHSASSLARLLRAAIAVAFVAMFSVLPVRVVHADNDDRRGQRQRQHQEQGRHEREDRGRYRRYPVRVPPPVYRPRYESPGIRLIIPIEIR